MRPTDVVIDEEKTVIEAFSEIATSYEKVVDDELQRFWGWRYQDFVNTFLETASIAPTDRVLDLATGTAVIPRKLIENQVNPEQIIGLDITFSMLISAKENLGQVNGATSLTCASAVHLPFSANSVDVITCGLATHHMKLSALIAEIKRVLKPGGQLKIADVSVPTIYRQPLVNQLLKALTFLYFIPGEGFARARAESQAVSNVRTTAEWETILTNHIFTNLSIQEHSSNKVLFPGLIIVQATNAPIEDINEHSH